MDDNRELAESRLRGSLHLYDDAIVLAHVDGPAYCVDPLDVAAAMTEVLFGSGWLPRNTLFYQRAKGRERIGIFVPPGVRDLSVVVAGETAWYQVPFPALLFVGAGTAYNLFAFGNSTRFGSFWPKPNEWLYLAPVPNVHSGEAGVCTGNVPFPVASPTTIYDALDLFFDSNFNRDLSGGKSKRPGASIIDIWAELSRAGSLSYPLDDLVSARITLREVIDAQ